MPEARVPRPAPARRARAADAQQPHGELRGRSGRDDLGRRARRAPAPGADREVRRRRRARRDQLEHRRDRAALPGRGRALARRRVSGRRLDRPGHRGQPRRARARHLPRRRRPADGRHDGQRRAARARLRVEHVLEHARLRDGAARLDGRSQHPEERGPLRRGGDDRARGLDPAAAARQAGGARRLPPRRRGGRGDLHRALGDPAGPLLAAGLQARHAERGGGLRRARADVDGPGRRRARLGCVGRARARWLGRDVQRPRQPDPGDRRGGREPLPRAEPVAGAHPRQRRRRSLARAAGHEEREADLEACDGNGLDGLAETPSAWSPGRSRRGPLRQPFPGRDARGIRGGERGAGAAAGRRRHRLPVRRRRRLRARARARPAAGARGRARRVRERRRRARTLRGGADGDARSARPRRRRRRDPVAAGTPPRDAFEPVGKPGEAGRAVGRRRAKR